MRKSFLMIACAILVLSGNAQYKKATILNKTGRIYDIGLTSRMQSGDRSSSFGFFISYGKESSEKRIHHWYDTELVLGNKFSYSTAVYGSSAKAQVSGKSGVDYGIRYNLAYFLVDNSKAENKLLPFLNVALGYIGRSVRYDDYQVTPNGETPLVTPSSGTAAFTYGGGGGIMYYVTPKLGIRLSAAYYGVTNTSNKSVYFSTLANHPAVSLAVRFKMIRDEE